MARPSETELLAGRYRRLSSIGIGGMARVYLAEDERLGRRVAVKQLHAAGPEDAALRFEREAKLGASLNHPNLVSIYDIATDEESVLIVMEYVDGTTLQGAIMRGSLPPERVVEVVRDVAAGLDHAHAHGIVHRDVKPANILLRRDGVAKLADLGIATAAERTSITRSDIVLGTASYMAPEQLAGERAGPAADVYALAAVAYEALCGQKARTGKTPVEVAHEIVNGAPPDLREARPEAPRGAAALLARGMDRDPQRRPGSAGEFAAGLERALAAWPAERSDATEATAALAASPAVGRGDSARQPSLVWPAEGPAPRRERAPSPTAARATPRRRRPAGIPAVAGIALIVLASAAGIVALGAGDDGAPDRREPVVTDRADSGSSGSSRRGSTTEQSAPAPEASPEPAPVEPDRAPPSATDAAADPAALNDEGYRLMQAGDYEAAIPLLEQAVAAYPEGSQELTYAYALYNLGRSLRLAGRASEAVPILERRLRIPNQTETVRRELEAARAAS